MSKRSSGEGSYRQRPDGNWEGRYYFETLDGRRVRQSYYAPTRREAVQKVNAARAAATLGHGPGGRQQILAAFLKSWLFDTARPKLKTSTWIRYRELVLLHLMPGLGHITLDKLSVQHVQNFLSVKQEAGLSAQTCHHLRAVLRTALNHAVKIRLLSFNAAALADSPRIPQREPSYLRPEQVNGFLAAAAEDDELGALFIMAFATGARQGELLALQWGEVDLDRSRVQIRRSARRMRVTPGQPTQLKLTEPKSATSRRTIPLAPIAVAALREHRQRQIAAGIVPLPTSWVFTLPDGQPVEASHLVRRWAGLLRRAGLPRMRFHDLRHSTATFLLASGVSPRTVMGFLGHANVAVTMGIYGHTNPEMLGDASDAMERILTR